MLKKIRLSEPYLNSKEINSVKSVLKTGWITNGPKTIEFEQNVKKIIGCKNAIAVNSCTNGIFASLHALGLKRGDEVITTPLTFVSTIHNLFNFGLKIKLIDINLKDLSIDHKELQKKITKNTKCVLVTHYGGIPASINKIIQVCKRNKIKVIEDAATVFGASINKKMIGSYNYSLAVFSFYTNKIITTGEGGIITTNNNNIAKKLKSLISCGISEDSWRRNSSKKMWTYQVNSYGFKYNFTDLQASIGIEQLKKLKKIQNQRRKLRKHYDKKFYYLTKNNLISILNYDKNKFFSEYIYTILLNEEKNNFSRDGLMNFLKSKNIDTTFHYITANKHNFYKKKFKNFKLPNSDYVFRNIISLPFHNKLRSGDIDFITKNINEFIVKKNKLSQK